MTQLQIKRKEAGLSQSELAKAAEMSVRTIQELESGRRNINKTAVVTVLKLSKILGCGIEDIMEEA